MRKARVKIFFLLLFLIVVAVGTYFGYSIFYKHENPLDSIFNRTTKNTGTKDFYNGVYSFVETIDKSYNCFSGCTVTQINRYILVIDEEYSVYRSSCLGTFLVDSGSTTDLILNFNYDSKEYEIVYKDNTYEKNHNVMSIVPNNAVKSGSKSIVASSYRFMMEQTQFEGSYYTFEKKLSNLDTAITLKFLYDESSNNFIMTLSAKKSVIYTYMGKNITDFPDLYSFGSKLVIIERGYKAGDYTKYNYNFVVIANGEISYQLNEYLPITVNDVQLNANNSIYIKYDTSAQKFKMLIGDNDTFCDEDDDTDPNKIVYYEFTIDYDYYYNKFVKPQFVKVGYAKDGCDYPRAFMGG